MNKPKWRVVSLIGILLLGAWLATQVCSMLPIATYAPALAIALAGGECIQSFHGYAYRAPHNIIREKVLPLPPWQIEATLPPQRFDDHYVGLIQVALTRLTDGHQEIWITEYVHDDPAMAIYTPTDQTWEVISPYIGETGLYVRLLFVTDDGTVWGRTDWNPGQEYAYLETVPVLSRFSENTRRFELAEGVLEIPLVQERDYFNSTKIVLDDHNIFWIFAENDGIYRYDPVTQTTERQVDLPNSQVYAVSLSPDGSIYFEKNRWDGGLTYRLAENTLFQFFTETGAIAPIDIPDDEWPLFTGLLADRSGRLWLGSIGYRDLDGRWHLLHPNPNEFFDHLGQYYWFPPSLIRESSDGRLWFARFLDTGEVDGAAWYDPSTGEGCMFTNQYAEVVEDSEQQLWLMADGTLYRYPLNP